MRGSLPVALLLSIICCGCALADSGNLICRVGTIDSPTIDGGAINIAMPNPKLSCKIRAADELNTDKNDWPRNKIDKFNYVLAQTKILGLPADIALLPLIESGYNDNAISPAGAVGSWQLMPALSRDYGLPPQRRADFMASTDVALLHLKNLHDAFGRWDLSLAAYNAGSTRVKHAMARNPTAQTIDELSLPLETKQYLHKINQLNKTIRGKI